MPKTTAVTSSGGWIAIASTPEISSRQMPQTRWWMWVSPVSTSFSHENRWVRMEWVMNRVIPNVAPKAISMKSAGWRPSSTITSL